ncbi:arabinan endo-1,5-alpha-L-arabinosidase [Gilvimarinus sp. SDUM040013]|uniref:Extracellular exo-alpha-(1->5)-L-arabinofuranosidase n=1 Tax=Gilvimarinus gilvus TaxID=3058038 RepID=A0ABU4RVN8_9GAMM|nr:arabinan endo-1,5-alpha-L-arabinosidase [Gilvimarinus sp. SDUM040013]MDO3387248.1 arabinan endo-1,5-alpha-L-arabinosidase [Gilvimarinus sp. SDUM040013]MDX6848937.1 arabinan endo-1,5-alpha-L-arabinosidase [Gilvimarinus sp. SDUM040013]
MKKHESLSVLRGMAFTIAIGAIAALTSACSEAQPEFDRIGKQVSIHDPVMAEEDGVYYLFSTGPGITIYRSKDRINWELQGRAFATEPTWAKSVAPGFRGHLWAPDVVEKDGKFHLYYSVSAFGKNTSAIGVTVTETLDPSADNYGWQDQGIVIQSVPGRDNWNAIDPAVIRDENGDGWMAFGSFWSGHKLFKLNEDWTAPAQPQQWHGIAFGYRPADVPPGEAGPTELEAPFLFKHGDFYYQFISLGKCCRGADSTYHIGVGRSESVTGPYLDKDGRDLAQGGGSVILKGNKQWPGIGHNSAYTFDGADYLVFHAYESADNGLQKLKILPIEWQDGWPTVDPAGLDEYQSVQVKSID